jgi:phosphoribosylamine--glycine ligase
LLRVWIQRPARPARPQVFHAGTGTNAAGDVVATGGRVLGVTALGADVAEAQKRAYEGVAAVDWEGGFYRKDIGWRAVARLRAGSKEGAARR